MRRLASGSAIVAHLAALKLGLHLATAENYGLFIDELYFLACGEHLAWGYVDMPPLTALQAWLVRHLFGNSLFAIRVFPAFAGAGLVLLTGALVRALGGGRFAQGLAALAVAAAPAYVSIDSYLSMNSIEPLLWSGCALVLARIITSGNLTLWLWFGILAGLGLENKHTMLLFGGALVVGLLLTTERRLIANRWFVLGGLVAAAIALPNAIWVVQHHFPHLEQLANIRRNQRNVALNPLQFVGMQVLSLNPMAFPLWAVGLWTFLVSRNGKPYRVFGCAYLLTLAALLATGGRFYYVMPFYPILFAGGGVALERQLAAPGWGWARGTYVAALAITGLLLAPIMSPLLPPETWIRYTQALGITPPRIENRRTSALPQLLADRFGWPELATTVAQVFDSLPPKERERTAIFCMDYGEAGAIDFYGPALGLPKAISGHLTYWYWGPRDYTGDVTIVVGAQQRARLEEYFVSVTDAATVGHPYAMASQHFTIYVCRGLKRGTLRDLWPELKNWN